MQEYDKRREMLNEIKSLNFAIIDLSLYLDTHPKDQRILNIQREYVKKFEDLKYKYQNMYGPLTIYYPSNKWDWINEPWPWERGNF